MRTCTLLQMTGRMTLFVARRKKTKTTGYLTPYCSFFLNFFPGIFQFSFLFADAVDTATKEIGFFFPEFDMDKWQKDQKEQYRL